MVLDNGVFEGQWTSSMWPYVVTLLKCTPKIEWVCDKVCN